MSEPNEPEVIIKAVCNSPRHRGKEELVARFGRFRAGDVVQLSGALLQLGQQQVYPSGYRWLIWRPDRRYWSFTAWPGTHLQVHNRYDEESEKGSTYHWECERCGGSLDVGEDMLHQLLEDTHTDQLAGGEVRWSVKNDVAQGVSRVNLAKLRQVLGSIRPRR